MQMDAYQADPMGEPSSIEGRPFDEPRLVRLGLEIYRPAQDGLVADRWGRGMTWLRLYTGILNDPKVQRLDGDTFKAWINILCIAKEHNGTIPDNKTVAFHLRVDEATAAELVGLLAGHGLLDEGENALKPHNWDCRQYVSDVSTARVHRYRERQRNVSSGVSETPPDTETESESEQKKQRASRFVASEGFEDFWKAYPHKVGKGAAVKAYRAASLRATPAEILAGLKRYTASKPPDRPWCNPATFLNQERWTDEPADKKTSHEVYGPKRTWAEIKAEMKAKAERERAA